MARRLIATGPGRITGHRHQPGQVQHGAVMLVPIGDRLSAYGTRLASQALESAGLPALELHASMVDERLWDNAAIAARVEAFVEQRLL